MNANYWIHFILFLRGDNIIMIIFTYHGTF